MCFIFGLELAVAIPDAQALSEHDKSLTISVNYEESCSHIS